ncbi:MAG TPA: hypothetical protein VJM08_03615, partial [Anaerolineales bacterium]|nr:hypothetical protein [Anaerolineales bacterium]
YSIYFIDSNTGHVVTKEDLDWAKHGNFYSVSSDGTMRFVEKVENEKRTTYILDSKSREVLTSIEGKIALMYHLNDFVINPSMPNSDWSFWEDSKFKCTYGGIQLSPEFKASANREVLMVMNSYTKYQIWKVPTCEMVGELQFDQ